MAAAIALLVVGFTLVYSALKGLSLTEVLSGATGTKLDPKGGSGAAAAAPTPGAGKGATIAQGNDPKGKFKGPNAALLRFFADNAVNNFNLRITDTCRSRARACANGTCNSMHVDCRAFDASGRPSDMIAFTKWVDSVGGAEELFHTPAGAKYAWPDHDDHVHVGA